MIEPEKLIAGSKAVYGEERFNKLYGSLLPIPAGRIQITQDSLRLQLGGRELEIIHTPGHAMHHYAVVDAVHASIFPGDTFGVSYREMDSARGAFILPATTPTQFDPDQHIASIERMAAYRPESMYLMHFSRVTDVPRLAGALKDRIGELVNITKRNATAPDRYATIRADMLALWLGLAREHGVQLGDAGIARLLEVDLDLNTQGLIAWFERRTRS
jgi:glyoxylase-like metal-dependent hydrolase (beta-lactamase superfamily II)